MQLFPRSWPDFLTNPDDEMDSETNWHEHTWWDLHRSAGPPISDEAEEEFDNLTDEELRTECKYLSEYLLGVSADNHFIDAYTHYYLINNEVYNNAKMHTDIAFIRAGWRVISDFLYDTDGEYFEVLRCEPVFGFKDLWVLPPRSTE